MKIAVVGAGAIGGLVAGYLKNSKADVFLVGKRDFREAVGRDILRISGARGDFHVSISVFDKLNQKVDLVILAVKTQDLQAVIEENEIYLKDTLILTTQNGLRADEIAARYIPRENIISSIVMFGATYLEPGKILHNFEGKWILGRTFNSSVTSYALAGAGHSPDESLKKIVNVLSTAFSVVAAENILGMKWLKVFVNANNCIPAIIGKSMQEAFSNLELCKISLRIWQEGLVVVKQVGIKLVSLPDFPLERLLKLSALPQDESAKIFSGIMTNLSKEPLYGSILQSLKRGRTSEIDYINGEFARLAEKNGIGAPLNKKLVKLVHQVEKEKKFLSGEELIRMVK